MQLHCPDPVEPERSICYSVEKKENMALKQNMAFCQKGGFYYMLHRLKPYWQALLGIFKNQVVTKRIKLEHIIKIRENHNERHNESSSL